MTATVEATVFGVVALSVTVNLKFQTPVSVVFVEVNEYPKPFAPLIGM